MDNNIIDKQREKSMNFLNSLDIHQIKLHHGFAQKIRLMSSENTYFKYPVIGVLVAFEQGTDLSIIQAIFHKQDADGSLGAPAVVKKPVYESLQITV